MDEEIPLLNVESDEEETALKQFYDDDVLPALESTCKSDNEETVVKLIDIPNDCTESSLGSLESHNEEFQNLHPKNGAGHSTQDNIEISETSLKRLSNVHETEELSANLPENRNLPEGKTFHIFVSFCGKDQDLVKPIVRDLEKEGLRCMFHDRDFIPGKGIIKNIVDTLHQSQKILLMLTENYIKSGPCMFEHDQALYFYSLVERREHCIIPVKLRPCEVPPQLKRLTYIDAELEINLVDKIKDSYDTNDTAECYVPEAPLQDLGYPFLVNDVHPVNGSLALNVSASKIINGCRGAGWHFTALTESQKQKLQKAQLWEAVKTYEDIRQVINSFWFMKLHDMLIIGTRWALSVCLFIITMIFTFSIASSVHYAIDRGKVGGTPMWIVIIVVFCVLTCCLSPCLTLCLKRQAQKRFASTLWKVGKEYFVKNKFFIVLEDANMLKLSFIYYDAKPCLEYITRALERSPRAYSQTPAVDIIAEHYLELAIVKQFYEDVFVWSKLQESDERRHNYPIYFNRVCLCQQTGIEVPNGRDDDVIIV